MGLILKIDTSFSILITFYMFTRVKNTWPIKYQVYNCVFEILFIKKKVLIYSKYIKSF